MIALALMALQSTELVRVTTFPLSEQERVGGTLMADLDGDGRQDLLMAVRHVERGFELRAFLGGPSGPSSTPAWVQPLTADAVAYAVGELTPAEGREVLLVSATGAFALAPNAPEEARFTLLGDIDFLWQAPTPGVLLPWPIAVADLDGDGDDDLLLPEADGFRVLRQARGPEGVTYTSERLELDPDPTVVVAQQTLDRFASLRPEATITGATTLVEIVASTPAPFVLDEDGDGRLDVAVQNGRQRVTWLGRPDGFERREQQLPFEVDLERQLDLSFANHLGDLDGDGRAESVVVARERRDGDDRTQVLVYGQTFERIQQALILRGLIAGSELVDVDGDGDLDLATIGVGDDLFEALRSGATDGLVLTVNVFRNDGGTLVKRPVLVEELEVSTEADGEGDGF
ncbi:MAG: VCBS repeat-containing protein, partial [Planctomycetota bacterium]